jgi:hypothetical protein
MSMLTILLAGLLASQEIDPEPPKPGPVGTRLVAKKATYKLDRGGLTEKEYADAAKAGTAALIPVEIELVITNHSKNDVRVRVSGAVPKLTLTLNGKGAVDGPKDANPFKGKLTYVVLKPGQKVSVPINKLMSYTGSKGGTTNHYWTEPGDYTLSASFYTSVDLDYTGKKAKLNYMTLKAPAISLKVEK